MQNRIEIASKHKNLLAEEFETSLTTVQMSLNFFNNSELAIKIRKRAKELLIGEAEKVEA